MLVSVAGLWVEGVLAHGHDGDDAAAVNPLSRDTAKARRHCGNFTLRGSANAVLVTQHISN